MTLQPGANETISKQIRNYKSFIYREMFEMFTQILVIVDL